MSGGLTLCQTQILSLEWFDLVLSVIAVIASSIAVFFGWRSLRAAERCLNVLKADLFYWAHRWGVKSGDALSAAKTGSHWDYWQRRWNGADPFGTGEAADKLRAERLDKIRPQRKPDGAGST